VLHFHSEAWRTAPYDPEMAKIVLFQMIEEAGVKLLLHSFVTGAVTEGDAVRGIVVESKSGRQVVTGKVICDATGDGDVAASAGAPFVKGQGQDLKLFAMTMLVRLSHVDWPRATEYSTQDPGWDGAIARAISHGDLPYYGPRTRESVPYWGHPRPELARLWWEDGALLWGGSVEGVDGTDVDSLTHAEAECRKQWMSELGFLRKYVPGFESARVESSGVTIGVRDTRHIVGEYTYTGYDLLEEREFPDTAAYIVQEFLGVPYRCLVPKQVDSLLIASRCLSVAPGQTSSGPTLGAYNDMKSIPTVMTFGEAAGTAAALAARMGVTPRELDVSTLQRALMAQGALLESAGIDRVMGLMVRPDGTPYKESLRRRHEDLRRHWEAQGYSFFASGR
jgi:hypothetical protein